MVVTEVYGGGSVVGKFLLSKSSTQSSPSSSTEARIALESKLTFLISGEMQFSSSASSLDAATGETSSKLGLATLEWNGGDNSCHRMTLNDVTAETWRTWEDSLLSQPTILTNQVSSHYLY